jgi:threonine aldolase
MRQVGVLAAPGLIALRDGPSGMIERLAEDHVNARRLAEGLAEMPGIRDLDPTRVRTNFVLFRVGPETGGTAPRAAFLDALAAEGVLMIDYPGGQVRAVTHYGIDAVQIDRVLAACRRALGTAATTPLAAGVA